MGSYNEKGLNEENKMCANQLTGSGMKNNQPYLLGARGLVYLAFGTAIINIINFYFFMAEGFGLQEGLEGLQRVHGAPLGDHWGRGSF